MENDDQNATEINEVSAGEVFCSTVENDSSKLCEYINSSGQDDELKVCKNSTKFQDSSSIIKSENLISCCPHCIILEKKLKEEESKCKQLRANVHKVSSNWFLRKTLLSESESSDSESQAIALTTYVNKFENDEDGHSEDIFLSDTGKKEPCLSKDFSKLIRIIAQKSAQLDLADGQCYEMKKRLREYEAIIDDKDQVMCGLKDQLGTYLTDNQKMAQQLNNISNLFMQLEKINTENPSTSEESHETDESEVVNLHLPTHDDYKIMSTSVSKTYLKLRDLIYEKKSLVTEIERLNILNIELQRRVLQQETRLLSVSDALSETWLVVSHLKEEHAKLHDDELIMKYELKAKRSILTKLRLELESARSQWQEIRRKNYESELEYASIRAMLLERKKSDKLETEEHKFQNNQGTVLLHPDDRRSFDPPIDLLVEMGIEYGIIGEDGEMKKTVVDVIEGGDIRRNKLEQLEEHCSLLYQKLVSSTSRSLSLASRLSRLDEQVEVNVNEIAEEFELVEDHFEYAVQEAVELTYLTDANQLEVIDSFMSTADSEEYDTAYVSENDDNEETDSDAYNDVDDEENEIDEASYNVEIEEELCTSLYTETDENSDQLSKTLINYLPRKIEILKDENKILENNIVVLSQKHTVAEEKTVILEKELEKTKEVILTDSIHIKQLEEQLKHLGKYVDELKLQQKNENSATQNPLKNNALDDKKVPDEPGRSGLLSNNIFSKSDNKSGCCSTAAAQLHIQALSDDKLTTDSPGTRTIHEKMEENFKLRKDVEIIHREMKLVKREKELKRKESQLQEKLLLMDRGNECIESAARVTEPESLDEHHPAVQEHVNMTRKVLALYHATSSSADGQNMNQTTGKEPQINREYVGNTDGEISNKKSPLVYRTNSTDQNQCQSSDSRLDQALKYQFTKSTNFLPDISFISDLYKLSNNKTMHNSFGDFQDRLLTETLTILPTIECNVNSGLFRKQILLRFQSSAVQLLHFKDGAANGYLLNFQSTKIFKVCIIRTLSESQSEVTHLQPRVPDELNSQIDEIPASANVADSEVEAEVNSEVEASKVLPFVVLFQVRNTDDKFAASIVTSISEADQTVNFEISRSS